MIKSLAAFCLILSTASCASFGMRPPPDVNVSEDFTADERQSIAKAAEKWNTVVRTPVTLQGSTWELIKVFTPDMAAKGFVGQTDYPGRLIRIKPDLAPATFYATVLHELGHAQGLHHIAGPGVMNPTVGATEFSPGDLEECQTENVCGYSPVEAAKLRLQGVIE